MTVAYPESHKDLLEDGMRTFAVLTTLMGDGTPQATPIWFNFVEGQIQINTARGRVKAENMSTRPQIALVVVDPENPYRYMQVRGRVVNETEENARQHIDELAGKYSGTADYKNYHGETRVKYTIEPQSIDVMG